MNKPDIKRLREGRAVLAAFNAEMSKPCSFMSNIGEDGAKLRHAKAKLEEWLWTHQDELLAAYEDAERWRKFQKVRSAGWIIFSDGQRLNCDEPESEWNAHIDAMGDKP